jgi:hypothetical protein
MADAGVCCALASERASEVASRVACSKSPTLAQRSSSSVCVRYRGVMGDDSRGRAPRSDLF